MPFPLHQSLDSAKTFFSYEQRLRRFSPRRFQRLKKLPQPIYISSYQTFGTDLKDRANHDTRCNPAYVCMRVMRDFGVPIKGVTSERKKGNRFVADLLDGDTRETSTILYVGKYNYFTEKKSSPWRLLPSDMVRMLPNGDGGRSQNVSSCNSSF